MANSSDSPATTLNIGDEEVTVTVTDLNPVAPPTRRTRAEISAEAARKRVLKAVERAAKAAARLTQREQRKAEKAERRARAMERSKAAFAKRIAADKKRRERRESGRQVIGLRPETPRHVFAERLQDDPNKVACNHVVDPSWADEDAFIARLDADRSDAVEAETAVEELDLRDRIALGVATMADAIALLAIELEEMVEDVVAWLVGIGRDTEEVPDATEALVPAKQPWRTKIGGGYCVSDIPSDFHHTIHARRGNGWKVHRKYQNRPVSV